MIKGACLCGVIKFTAVEIPGMVFNCHCFRCQRSHGASYSTQVVAERSTLLFIEGKSYLTEYVSATSVRTFCSLCGSRLMNYGVNGEDYLSVAASVIEDGQTLMPVGECYVSSKRNSVKLNPEIPHYLGLPK